MTPYLQMLKSLKKGDAIYVCNYHGDKIPCFFEEFNGGKCIAISGPEHFEVFKTPFAFNMTNVKIEKREVK